MKDEKTMYPYFPEWMPTGAGCAYSAEQLTKENYYG